MRPKIFSCVLVVCACSSGSPSPPDAGADAAADAASDATDAGVDAAGCVVQTCNGTVSLYLGQTIPYGDTCGAETCSWKGSGGFTMCGCTFINGCPCPDAGP